MRRFIFLNISDGIFLESRFYSYLKMKLQALRFLTDKKMVLETERLILRRWENKDLEPFYQMSSDLVVMEHYPALLTKEDSERFVAKMKIHFEEFGYGLWILEIKNTKEWVGYTGFLNVSFTAPFTPAVEIGWRLNSSFWNRGYATEAAFVCLNYGFERFGFSKIVSFTSVLNTRSESVMKKIGLKKIGSFYHPNLPIKHRLSEHVLYQITSSEWNERNVFLTDIF
ncbi:GNAT family N-acetyltransferase [Leptospira interrogans]|uniref:GNAT family N-acetyltransferase n=1 Tax=Leptospira interrogans TaxID=173 RepID=UPI0002B8B7F6|nr:GNAT family N-acetyltransferase [Leptospira interrogans]EMF71475.1 acetyltransferase (GNAT) domain protein [Leptospira interrogans serovar Canicola str. LT1962]EMM90189.1 acetyltransferase (GNAT) domain protein [Leptospira interrogans serovar Djasiman str. LT1649]